MSWNAVVVFYRNSGGTSSTSDALTIGGFSTEALALAAGEKIVEAKKMVVSSLGQATYSPTADHVVGKSLECYVTAVEIA